MLLYKYGVLGASAAGHHSVDVIAILIHGFDNMPCAQRQRLNGCQITQRHIFWRGREFQASNNARQIWVGTGERLPWKYGNI